MLLNSAPLNSGPLNSLSSASGSGGGGSEPPPDPVELEPGSSFTWTVQVLLGGVDVTEQLTGTLRVERPEDGDSVASFALWLGDDPVDVASYTGAAVSIDYIAADEPAVVSRRFTGALVQPEFDVISRVLSCDATTRLTDTIEAMELEDIDLLVGGLWSEDVFENVAGRQRWDYAQERLSTRPASLNADNYGEPRITPWHAPGISYEFGPGSTVYESVDVALARLGETTNVIELEVDYRYSRYRQRNQHYTWSHPGTGGNTSILGFEAWLGATTELPDIDMVVTAVDSAGWYLSRAAWGRLPGDMPELRWFNSYPDLLLHAEFTASVRWTQRAVEQYRLRLEVPEAAGAVGEVIRRDRVVLDSDTEADRLWEQGRTLLDDEGRPESQPITRPTRREQGRLDRAVTTALARAQTQLLAAQRGNRVGWQAPLAHALDVEVGLRVRLRDQGATATGTVVGLADDLDLFTGAALLTVTIAVSQGTASAASDPPAVPGPPHFTDAPGPTVSSALPTQLIRHWGDPPYDEELPGFSGAHSVGTWNPELRYPRRFAIDTPEIPDQWRDEITATRDRTYRVAPPIDELEI